MADLIECIIFESTRVNNRPYQQLSNLSLEGLSTRDETLNTDNGKLYGSLGFSTPTYTLSLYKDVLKTELVARATATSLGVATVSEQNASGLSGSVNFAQYSADDNSIEVRCFLSRDLDFPLRGLEGLCDYDAALGFAHYHLLAFQYFKDHIISRYKSILWNKEYIDTRQVNGGLGGYDLSRCLNLHVLKEASAHYAFARVAERQGVEKDGMWMTRAKQSKDIANGFIKELELTFDTDRDRVENKSRAFSTLRMQRS